MSKKISGSEYNLAKIFSSDFEFHIPHYQRPYAWTVDQASELFDDLYGFYSEKTQEGYFLGSIVLIKEEGNPNSEVIDGQQRLTTLTILLAAIAYCQSDPESRNDILNYIREVGSKSKGLKARPRLTLRGKDQVFFNSYIQELGFQELIKLDLTRLETESQVNIAQNAKYFLNKIKGTFSSDTSNLEDFIAFLVQRCFLVTVSTPNQQSAFRVFSVMNNRGLDLQTTDIIKADLIGKIPECDQKKFNERWEEMEIQLTRSGFNDLFSYVRMICAKEKAKRSLLEEFRSYVTSKTESAETLIDTILIPYANALATIKQANYQASSNAKDVNTYLHWLNRIDNSDWIPSAILFLAKHSHNPGLAQKFFKGLERLSAYLFITGKNINHRIERYREVLQELECLEDGAETIQAVELRSVEIQEMTEVLNGNIYELPPKKRNYIILRLDSFVSDQGAVYDPSILTIEHVLPQTVDNASEWVKLWPDTEERTYWLHKLANLVPLNRRRNSQAQNFDFSKKKTAYFGGKENITSYALTSQVLNTEEWTPDNLKNRQEELLEAFSKNWELSEAN